MTTAGAVAAPAAPRNPWVIAPVVALAAFMEVLDISIANVALQHISGALAASQDESTWILTSYLVTNAIVLPISGWLANTIGRKRFFMMCIAGFSLSSLMCGLAPNLFLLIVFRALQGLTGGGLQPNSQAILADSFPPAKRGMAFAMYGMAVVFAPAIGPTLGGWITDNSSWRWVFLINVPVGVILFMLISMLIHDPPAHVQARKDRHAKGFRVDYIGFGLLFAGLGLLQLVLDKGQRLDWFESDFIVGFSALSVAALIAFVYWELRSDDPIVDLKLLKDRTFAVANALMFMLGFILLGSTVLIPLLVQTLLGYTATDAGMVISPGGFAIILVMPIIGRLVSLVDVRWLIVAGLLICAFSLYRMTGLSLDADYSTFMWLRVIQALGLSLLFIPINTIAYTNIPQTKSSQATAIINVARNLGGSVGISLVTTMLVRHAQIHQNFLAAHVTPYSEAYNSYVAHLNSVMLQQGGSPAQALAKSQSVIYNMVQQQSTMLSYIDDFRMLAILFVVIAPFVFLMRKARPHGGPAGAH